MVVKRKITQKKRWQVMLLTLLMSVFSFVPSYSADSFINEQKSKNFSAHVWQFYGDTKKGIKRVIKNVSKVTVGSVVILGVLGAVFLGMPARAAAVQDELCDDVEGDRDDEGVERSLGEEVPLIGRRGDGNGQEIAGEGDVVQSIGEEEQPEVEQRPEEEKQEAEGKANRAEELERMVREFEEGPREGHPHYELSQEFPEDYRIYKEILFLHYRRIIFDASVDTLRPILAFMRNGPSEDHPHYRLYRKYEKEYCLERHRYLTEIGTLLIDVDMSVEELEKVLSDARSQEQVGQEEAEQQAVIARFNNFKNVYKDHPKLKKFKDNLKALERIDNSDEKRRTYRRLCLEYHPDKWFGDDFYNEAMIILADKFDPNKPRIWVYDEEDQKGLDEEEKARGNQGDEGREGEEEIRLWPMALGRRIRIN